MTDSATQQPASETPPEPARSGFSGAQVGLIVLVAIVITAVGSFLLIRAYVFPADIQPVTLTATEEQQLDQKLRLLGWQPERPAAADANDLTPEPYTESDEAREVSFSERELNALIGGDPELGRRVAIDLSDDLASAKILVPVPQDFPIMPGQTVRVNAGLEVWLNDVGQPVVVLRGVSVMGVPVPNAWLGNIKNVDLVGEFGDSGFWKAFADGVEDIQIRDGELYVKLRE
jgi:arginine N-succinyltransferase